MIESAREYLENGFCALAKCESVRLPGGFTTEMQQKETRAPIKNEAANGLKNLRGTVAMARTMVVDSATSQFFINLKDNGFLDHTAPNPRQFGYAVFGRVTKGMDVVDKIALLAAGQSSSR